MTFEHKKCILFLFLHVRISTVRTPFLCFCLGKIFMRVVQLAKYIHNNQQLLNFQKCRYLFFFSIGHVIIAKSENLSQGFHSTSLTYPVKLRNVSHISSIRRYVNCVNENLTHP